MRASERRERARGTPHAPRGRSWRTRRGGPWGRRTRSRAAAAPTCARRTPTSRCGRSRRGRCRAARRGSCAAPASSGWAASSLRVCLAGVWWEGRRVVAEGLRGGAAVRRRQQRRESGRGRRAGGRARGVQEAHARTPGRGLAGRRVGDGFRRLPGLVVAGHGAVAHADDAELFLRQLSVRFLDTCVLYGSGGFGDEKRRFRSFRGAY